MTVEALWHSEPARKLRTRKPRPFLKEEDQPVTALAFLDTEFTGLDQPAPRLISLALVPEQGDDTLYLELPREDWIEQASYWTLAHVLPCLRGGAAIGTVAELRERLLKWLDRQGEVQVITDYPEYDFAFLQAMLGTGHPALHAQPIKFGVASLGEVHRAQLEQARAGFYSASHPPHNALADALASRAMWRAARALDADGLQRALGLPGAP